MSTIPAAKARAALPAILDRVRAGEEVTITRHGEPVAVVVRPDRLGVRRASVAIAAGEQLLAELEEARNRPLPQPGITNERAEELVAAIRRERDER
jgi:antitoxin (DNA-binding transcriptional repressor) of toxin-antitoxin stability system